MSKDDCEEIPATANNFDNKEEEIARKCGELLCLSEDGEIPQSQV